MGKESRDFFGSWLGAFDFCESRAHLSRFQFVLMCCFIIEMKATPYYESGLDIDSAQL